MLRLGPAAHRNSITAFTLALAALWLWLYRPVLAYLALIYRRDDFRTNQLLLIGVVVLVALQIRAGRFRPRLGMVPVWRPLPLTLALGASLAYLATERWLDVNTLSAALFGLASYGLVGLWLAPADWRRGLPAALLVIGTLPFGEHLQTFVGYPMRILTAGIVRDLVAALGARPVGVDTILVIETGVSQVDLPCSGVKSLWTGLLFLTAATWIERRRIGPRWLAAATAFAGLLFLANLARVAILVLVGSLAHWPLLAEMLHVPLGVLGFAGCCAAAVWMLRRLPEIETPGLPDESGSRLDACDGSPIVAGSRSLLDQRPAQPQVGPWFPALVAAILVMVLAYSPRPQTGLAGPPPDWSFPAEMAAEPLPLRPDEVKWLTRDGAESATRYRFDWHGVSGSMILISSTTWRAHHRPERCFEVYGLRMDDTRTHLVRPDFPLRVVALSDPRHSVSPGGAPGAGPGDDRQADAEHGLSLSAAYWFQSGARTTDDYATRIWADLAPARERWVMVSLLLDDRHDPDSPEIRDLYLALHAAVARQLAGPIVAGSTGGSS